MAKPEQTVEDAFLAYRATRDPSALAAVYDGTSSRLLAVALHLSSSANLAEDAVQDTFLFALEHPERWDETRPLMPWLLGILANRLRQGAYRARRTPDPERLKIPEAPDPQSELQANEMLSRIEDAITHLPQPYRTVVLLRLRNGLNPADIAVALDRKPSTVRAQLTRGVEMLRKVLPAGIAALLIGSATAARGMNAAREVVLQRATEVHDALVAQHRLMLLRSWTAGLCGVAAVAAVVWWVAVGVRPEVAPVVPPPAELAIVANVEPVVREERLQLPADVRTAVVEQEQPVAVGSLTVSVARPDLVMAAAQVEIEPLGNPPRALVHNTTTERGTWQEIVPITPPPAGSRRYGRTGEDGSCSFDGVPAGVWVCRSLGVDRVVQVRGGEHAELELPVEPGCRLVRGLVVDGQGRAVHGARVWISRLHRGRFVTPVTRTDASGRFSLAVAPWTTLGASSAGYAPVALSIGEQSSGPPLELTFTLTQPAGILCGRVVDEDDRPVPFAEVELGHLLECSGPPMSAAPDVLARPERIRADDAGRFEFDAVVAGETMIAAHAKGFGAVARAVSVRAGEEAEVELRLPRGAVVEGVVQYADGAPVVAAAVRIARAGSIDHCAAVTDEQGHYRLVGVTPGEPLVEVADYRGGFASRALACRSGETTKWDVTLRADALALVGRVVDADGRALAYGWVCYTPHSGHRLHQLDAEGRFAIPVSEREAAVAAPVLVFDHDPRDLRGRVWGVPRVVVNDLRVDDGDAEIRLPATDARTSWLRGRIVDARGKLSGRAVVLRASDGARAWRIRLDPLGADGSFEVGPLPADSYTIHLPHEQMSTFGPFELGERQSMDLGVLHLEDAEPRVPIRLGLVFPPGEPTFCDMEIEARDRAGRLVLSRYHAGSVTRATDPLVMLPVGTFRVVARTKTGLVAEREVEVEVTSRRQRVPLLQFARR